MQQHPIATVMYATASTQTVFEIEFPGHKHAGRTFRPMPDYYLLLHALVNFDRSVWKILLQQHQGPQFSSNFFKKNIIEKRDNFLHRLSPRTFRTVSSARSSGAQGKKDTSSPHRESHI